jgi:isopentenyl-diphosphate delta-isomerase
MSNKSKVDIEQRKADHIELAFASQSGTLDERFSYEPLLSGHPADGDITTEFLGKTLRYPLWVSSMTGGTEAAGTINRNLAKMCGEFGLGMGLGSCRVLLDKPDRLMDFEVRKHLGPDLPLYANLGLAQVEGFLDHNEIQKIHDLIEMVEADGLIIHVNPLQEWLQPGGDHFEHPPIDTISRLLEEVQFPVIVKEVGQGMGPESLAALMQLPIAAIELAAHGGTNFSLLELLREDDPIRQEHLGKIASVGHSAEEMIGFINRLKSDLGDQLQCRQIIISGGVRDYLDGFYLMKKLTLPSIYGHASGFLKYAQEGYEQLQAFARIQTAGLKLAHTYLRVR